MASLSRHSESLRREGTAGRPQSLVDAYGIDFLFAGSQPRRFIFYESFPFDLDARRALEWLPLLTPEMQGSLVGELVLKFNTRTAALDVALAYVIELARHGPVLP